MEFGKREVCGSTSKIRDAEKERKTGHFAFSGNLSCVFYVLAHGELIGTVAQWPWFQTSCHSCHEEASLVV
jgi:hypothetical protein